MVELKFRPLLETPEQRLVWEAFFFLPIIIIVFIFGQLASTHVIYTIIISIVFGLNLTIRFLLLNEKGDWLFYLFGVAFGGGNDLMSMINGVYNYTSVTILPFLAGLLPLWMILFWGQICLLFRKVFNVEWFKGEEFQKDGRFLKGWIDERIIIDIIILFVLRMTIYRTYLLDMWVPALIYAIGIGVRFIIFPPKKNELLIMVILPYAFLFEGLMVLAGLYVYYNPILLGMPLWLYLWWIFLVPIVVKEFFDRFEYYFQNKT